jgi:16S rRNA (cytosine967-C5)-methyltransferase
VRLSYPDWIVDWARQELGDADGIEALAAMNQAATVTRRADGYVQDRASQWVTVAVGAQPGERVLDLCAAPGGKATALAEAGAHVTAVDRRPHRAATVQENARTLGVPPSDLAVVVADGRAAPFGPETFDRVLVDAPCSGLGVLRRRPDARWRVTPTDVTELADLQQALLTAAAALVRPGGRLVYSVCTLTEPETTDIDTWLADALPDLEAVAPPEPWQPRGRGGWLLPQWEGTDGMYLLMLDRPAEGAP